MPNIPVKTILPWLLGFVGLLVATGYIRQNLRGRMRAFAMYAAVAASALAFGIFAGKLGEAMPQVSSDTPHQRAADVVKAAIAFASISAVMFELRRLSQGRPIAERWKKAVGITLGVISIALYFNTFKFGYPKYYHRWDQYHYYMGAKYFPELGYDGLYKCSAVAQDELGTVFVDPEEKGRPRSFNLKAEVRKGDKKIRNLGGDNLLIRVDELLEHPEQCRDLFTPARWEEYKKDVTFFSTQCYVDSYWTQMQQDHGYNPPPVWTLAGYYLANWFPTTVGNMQMLAMIDVLYLLAVFLALYWAFGWRVFSVAAIFWGCQSSAPFFWTGGALLRQDWLFFFVMAACFARKKYPALAGASLVYSALLRVFPGLAVVGWLAVAGLYIGKQVWKRRRARLLGVPSGVDHLMKPEHVRMLIGGTAAAAILLGASVAVVGKDSYTAFFKHTIEVHDQTPLTNHMGLRVLIGHDVGFDKDSGRMRYAKDATKTDPFEGWKTARNERYKDYKPVAYGTLAVTLFAFVLVLRRIKNQWMALALGGIWIILGSQLTCYYYSYMLLLAVLSRMRRDVEVYIFAMAAISQIGWRTIGFNDDRYTYLTLISLILSYLLLFMFAPKELPDADPRKAKLPWWDRLSGPRLGALVCLVPGVIFMLMGLMRKDWSTVLIGGLSVAGAAGLFLHAKRLAAAPYTPRDPELGASGTSLPLPLGAKAT